MKCVFGPLENRTMAFGLRCSIFVPPLFSKFLGSNLAYLRFRSWTAFLDVKFFQVGPYCTQAIVNLTKSCFATKK